LRSLVHQQQKETRFESNAEHIDFTIPLNHVHMPRVCTSAYRTLCTPVLLRWLDRLLDGFKIANSTSSVRQRSSASQNCRSKVHRAGPRWWDGDVVPTQILCLSLTSREEAAQSRSSSPSWSSIRNLENHVSLRINLQSMSIVWLFDVTLASFWSHDFHLLRESGVLSLWRIVPPLALRY
jgi:hypothetical protein